jgi:hypothetical protein
MISMNMLRYHPPIKQEEVTGYSRDELGKVNGISLMLKDANGLLFSLHVATDANYLAVVTDDPTISSEETLEPVFIVPVDSIDEKLVSAIVNGTSPDVLSMYLVAQD